MFDDFDDFEFTSRRCCSDRTRCDWEDILNFRSGQSLNFYQLIKSCLKPFLRIRVACQELVGIFWMLSNDFIQLRKDDIKTTSVLYFPIRLFFLRRWICLASIFRSTCRLSCWNCSRLGSERSLRAMPWASFLSVLVLRSDNDLANSLMSKGV